MRDTNHVLMKLSQKDGPAVIKLRHTKKFIGKHKRAIREMIILKVLN